MTGTLLATGWTAASWWSVALGGVGWTVAATWLYFAIRLVGHARRQPQLAPADATADRADGPAVTIIVPACDESAAIEACLRSLVGQDYPRLTIIAINDRSTDDTGRIMDRVAADSLRLTVHHVTELPPGWLGKNHANWLGTQQEAARQADFLLFTDGDVTFAPDCVARAMRHVAIHGTDLQCLVPALTTHGFLESAICQFFGFCYLLKCKPWRIADPRWPNAYAGVGAFNCVRRRMYDACGGHATLRLEVLDDYKLGKLIKQVGGRVNLLSSDDTVRVRWQVGTFGVVTGLEKNAFAGSDYSVLTMTGSLLLMVLAFIVPVGMVIGVGGPARWGWTASVVAQVAMLGWTARRSGVTPWVGVIAPVCAVILWWACVRSMCLTLWRGGVRWRGTFYPLAELRTGLV